MTIDEYLKRASAARGVLHELVLGPNRVADEDYYFVCAGPFASYYEALAIRRGSGRVRYWAMPDMASFVEEGEGPPDLQAPTLEILAEELKI